MDEPKPMIGQCEKLGFSLEWNSALSVGSDLAADLTRGRMVAYVGGQVIWGKPGTDSPVGLEWTWVELLEHLAQIWNRLNWEEADPIGLNEILPKFLRMRAEGRWRNLAPNVREPEEHALWAFDESHNLALGLQGIWPPPIWIIRQGTIAYVSARDSVLRLPMDEVLHLLTQLGDNICARLQESRDPRSISALAAWRTREQLTPQEFVAISTGLNENYLENLVGSRQGDLSFWGLRKGSSRQTEILATARMAGGALPPRDLGKLLERVRKIQKRDATKLEEQSAELRARLTGRIFSQPCDEGVFLAAEMRDWLGNRDRHIDPEGVLHNWNVLVQRISLPQARQLDAICCWGPTHGPAVIVNEDGEHAGSSGGRRATLAHEICHLILDRQAALPLGEVLGGRVAQPVESRARAFAAEFLLPRAIVAEELSIAQEPKTLVQRLARRFDVSQEIVAWQARNSGAQLSPSQYHYLKGLVRESDRF